MAVDTLTNSTHRHTNRNLMIQSTLYLLIIIRLVHRYIVIQYVNGTIPICIHISYWSLFTIEFICFTFSRPKYRISRFRHLNIFPEYLIGNRFTLIMRHAVNCTWYVDKIVFIYFT